MRMSLLTRAAAATAIAAASALAVTSTVAAAPHPSKSSTTLSIRVSKSTIKRGQKVRVGGVLKGAMKGIPGQFVNLDAAAPNRKFVVIGSSATNKMGDIVFVVRQSSTERYRLVFKGAPMLAPARSAIVTVRVSDRVS
jgi:hypothetical protein